MIHVEMAVTLVISRFHTGTETDRDKVSQTKRT
jgi:hypothetical protein